MNKEENKEEEEKKGEGLKVTPAPRENASQEFLSLQQN